MPFSCHSPLSTVCLLLLLVAAPTITTADTVTLAECPKEPDVIGDFYNNGSNCKRDRLVVQREVVQATCPDGFSLNTGKNSGSFCRKPLKKHQKPICPEGYQRFGGECHSNCPNSKYQSKRGECVLPKKTLPPKFMSCTDPNQHRYQAYCCTPNVDCPQLTCNLGDHVPGTFFFNSVTGICTRQAESLGRVTQAKKRGEPCPDYLVQVWGVCQEACPEGFQAVKGKCVVRECIFDARQAYDSKTSSSVVSCPEGTYVLAQASI